MKTYSSFLIVAILPLIFCSCRSSRSMQKEIRTLKTDLYYELTSPEYPNGKARTVYLDFIDYSNLDYYTTVKKQGAFVLPLLFFNYETNRYRVTLGEGSLTQTYREFLTEALLTECNSSTHFNLKSNKESSLPDSACHLQVKIRCNRTTSGVNLRESSILWFDGNFIALPNHRARSAETELAISVRLSRADDCLLDKTYTVCRKQFPPKRGNDESLRANDDCLNTMADCLSLATKEIVENISQELDLVLSVP